jgi:2-methylcitrate dehydratase PrpD
MSRRTAPSSQHRGTNSSGDAWPCWVRVQRRDGTSLEARVDHPRGDPENFPADAELERKFRALAARTLAPAAIERLSLARDAFPRARSARALLAATVPTVS